MKYRKKPVVIEAVEARLIIESENGLGTILPDWTNEALLNGDIIVKDVPDGLGVSIQIIVKTLEGDALVASPIDMIIQGVEGEIYPCARRIFDATYDIVSRET